jgi:hypothetical protein
VHFVNVLSNKINATNKTFTKKIYLYLTLINGSVQKNIYSKFNKKLIVIQTITNNKENINSLGKKSQKLDNRISLIPIIHKQNELFSR